MYTELFINRHMIDPRVPSLHRIKKCMICLTHQRHLNPENSLGKEHIVPQQACDDHKAILFSLRSEWFNITKLCRKDHDNVERIKGYGDRNDLYKMIVGVANYPRSIDRDLLALQYNQWNTLFKTIRDNISRLNGATPPYLESLYAKTGDKINGILYEWEKGNFDLLIPVD